MTDLTSSIQFFPAGFTILLSLALGEASLMVIKTSGRIEYLLS
jgi:hypothetical protein